MFKIFKKIRRRLNCIIKQDTIVRVIGFEDAVNNFADFDVPCELNDSFKIALERWKDVFLKEKRSGYYTINVCHGVDCIYYIDNFGIHISEPYKDIVSFKNLEISDIPFQEPPKGLDSKPERKYKRQ